MQTRIEHTFYGVAAQYAELGWSVIPLWPLDDEMRCTCGDHACKNHGKHPLPWKAYQTRRPTDGDLWWWNKDNPSYQWGMACGTVSGIVVVDCDDAEAEAWADKHLPATPLRVKTTKGSHRYYRRGNEPHGVIPSWSGLKRLRIDLRGDNGYIVLPPTLHKSGRRYEWSSRPERLDEIPIYDPAWMPRPRPVRPATTNYVPPSGLTRSDAIRQAERYVANCPGAVAGAQGNTRSYRIACALVIGFGLDDSEALHVFNQWNQQCSPPWGIEECESFVRNARTYGKDTRPVGHMLRPKI